MKPENISDALGRLSDEILEETDRARTASKRKKWTLWAAAACLCLLAAGAFILPRLEQKAPDGLPLLELSMETGGMGFEGPICYDFSELDNGNPWREDMVLDTLPVYRNGSYSKVGEPVGLSAGEAEQRARAAAQALGVEITSLEQERDGYFTSGVTRVRALGEGVRIDADANGTVTVLFDGGLPLPEAYSFTYHDTSDREAEAVLDYLIDRYAGLLNFRQPRKVLSGERSVYGQFDRNYHVYDAAGDDVEDLLSYTFRYAQFAPDDHGNLMLIRLHDGLACAEKIGDYPLITLEEARAALLEGQYLTTVPYDFPGEDHVYGGELVYRGSLREQVFIPYYRFYADLTHEFPNWDNGLKNFGAYYVPAIQHQYLKPGWQWDGSFN